MTHQQIYDELKMVAEQKGLTVRLEMGDFDGGICTVNEQRVILVNRRHDISRRVHVIARALHSDGLDDVFIKPAIREVIEEVGVVVSIVSEGAARRLTIAATTVMDRLDVDDSVAVDGCCLTVVERTSSTFTAVAVEETLMKTTLGEYREGRRVNLERALRVGDRLGGHYVLGHVDCVGAVTEASERESSWIYWIRYPEEHGRLVIPVGSIAINGVSLTAADVQNDACMVSIIPHTHAVTTFGALAAGDHVNVEFDMIGKYVRNFVR